MNNTLYETVNTVKPILSAVEADTSGDSKKKLILMGAILVAFVIVFVVVSKKMKKK